MRLIALVATGSETAMRSDGGDASLLPAIRALIPLSGMTVIERQVRDLIDAGAHSVLVEAATADEALVAAIDRLKAAGLPCALVQRPADVLAHLGQKDRVLLLADGLAIEPALLAAMVGAPAPSILATLDDPLTASFERLDATSRWGGLAVVPADAVTALAALPGEWDMVLTLLRTAVQSGARRMPCAVGLFSSGAITMVTDAGVGAKLDRQLLRRIAPATGGLVGDRIVRPMARRIAPLLLRSTAACRWLAPLSLAGLLATLPVAWLAGTGAAGTVGLGALLLGAVHDVVAAFRRDGSALPRLMAGIHLAAIALLPAVIALAALAAYGVTVDAAISAAPAAAFSMLVLTARGQGRAQGAPRTARLPDAEVGWLSLAIAGWVADPQAASAMLALLGSVMLWWAGRIERRMARPVPDA